MPQSEPLYMLILLVLYARAAVRLVLLFRVTMRRITPRVILDEFENAPS